MPLQSSSGFSSSKLVAFSSRTFQTADCFFGIIPGPYGGAYPNADPQYPPLIQGNGPYYDPYGRAHIQGGMSAPLEVMGPHGNANGPSPPLGPIGGPPVSSAMAPIAWGGAYDPNGAQK